jgi:hypothetical protein
MYRKFTVWSLLLAAIVLLVACGGGGGDSQDRSASAAAEELFGYFENGQYGRQYDLLHPAQQAAVTRDAYMNCKAADTSIKVSDSKATEEYDETITVPLVGTIPTRAVTMEYHVGELVQHSTFHLIDVDGAWRWSLSPDELAAYQAGDCP